MGLACAQSNPAPQLSIAVHQALSEAQAAMGKDNFAKARKVLETYIKKHPQSPHSWIYFTLGNVHYQEGRLRQAYQAYRKGYQLDSQDAALCLNLARVSYELQLSKEAARLFKEAYGLSDPSDPKLLYYAAVAYYDSKAYHAAYETLSPVVKAHQKTPKDWVQLCIYCLIEAKRFAEAIHLLERYLAEFPGDHQFWELLGQVHMERQNYKGAAGCLEVSYRLEAPDKQKWKALAGLYLYQNAPLKAVQILERAYLQPTAQELEQIADSYRRAGRWRQALKCLMRCLEMQPTAKRYHLVGQIWYQQARWREALNAFKKADQLDPENAKRHLLMGFCAIELQNWPQARDHFQQAVQHPPAKERAEAALAAIQAFL
jgi:cytochrome c-type biogenesis protein CcmH/NrfG